MADPEPVLAAYSISFYFHATLGSPIWACQFVAVSYIKDRASMQRLLLFSLQVAAAVSLILLIVGLTPAGDWLFRTLFGASPEVAHAAQRCTLIFTFAMLFAVVRSLVYGLFMVERKTIYVTLGTVVRLVGLAAVLAGLTRFLEGAEVGAIALVACIGIETAFGVIVARPFFRRLPTGGDPPSYRELWKFSWPIMIMQTAESGVIFTINLFLGRLARPELALAAFGLLDSLMRVIVSPPRNVIQTVQTLVRFRRDVRVIVTFAVIVGAGFAGMMLLFHVERVRTWVLEGVMGPPPHGGIRGTRAGVRLRARARHGRRFTGTRPADRGQANRGDRGRLSGAAGDGRRDRRDRRHPRNIERRPHRDVRPHRRIRRRVGPKERRVLLQQPRANELPEVPGDGPVRRHRHRRGGGARTSSAHASSRAACAGPSQAPTPSSPCAAPSRATASTTSGNVAPAQNHESNKCDVHPFPLRRRSAKRRVGYAFSVFRSVRPATAPSRRPSPKSSQNFSGKRRKLVKISGLKARTRGGPSQHCAAPDGRFAPNPAWMSGTG